MDFDHDGNAQIEQYEGNQLPQQLAKCLDVVRVLQMREEPAIEAADPQRDGAAEPETPHNLPPDENAGFLLRVRSDTRLGGSTDCTQIVAERGSGNVI